MTRMVLLGLPALLAGLVVGLLLFAPANKVYGFIQTQVPAQIRISGVDGRVLQGHVSQVQAQGISLSPLAWRLSPMGLLGGKLAAFLQGELSSGDPVRAHVTASPSGALDVRDLRLQMSIANIAKLAKQPFVPVAGQVQLSLEQAQINAATRPEYLAGRLDIVGLEWTLLKPNMPLGNFEVVLRTDSEGIIRGDIRDLDAQLGARGEVSLSPDGRYTANLRLKPGPDTPALIRNGLGSLSRPNAEGEYTLSYNGQAPGW